MSRSFTAALAAQFARGNHTWVGLDPDVEPEVGMFPAHFPDTERERVRALCFDVMLGSRHRVAMLKPNLAFWLCRGVEGLEDLIWLIGQIRAHAPEVLIVLDGKFGDIGNTSRKYAQFAYDKLDVDGVTFNPYLGDDAIDPFLAYADRGVFVLCRTSNPGAKCVQDVIQADGRPYFLHMADQVRRWNEKNGNVGLVVGATAPAFHALADVRKIVGRQPILIPGVGKQGGKLEDVVPPALDADGHGFIVGGATDFLKAWMLHPTHDVKYGTHTKAQVFHEEIERYRIAT